MFILAGLALLSAPAKAGSAVEESIPEKEGLWTESLLWGHDVILRSGVGYKDNVLLSPDSVAGSAFFTSGVDLSLFRLPLDGWQFALTLVGDDVRYFRKPGGLAGEDLFASSAQLQRYLENSWRLGTELRYGYIDQVLQEFLDAGGVRAVEAKGHSLGVRPFIRNDFSTNWWGQLEFPVEHDWWQSPLDSIWKIGAQAVLGWTYDRYSQLSLSSGFFYIPHEKWLARDALGNELAGRLLTDWREFVEAKWDHHWDRHNRWQSVSRIGYVRTTDNGGGFFENNRYFVSTELRWHAASWEIKASGGFSYYDFPVQTVSASVNSTLHLATVDAGLRVSRQIYGKLGVFIAYEFQQTVSNDPVSSYRYNVSTAGMSWEF